jgi:hypothetical protein
MMTVPTPEFEVRMVQLDPLRECIVLPDAASVAPPARRHPWLSPRAGQPAPAP